MDSVTKLFHNIWTAFEEPAESTESTSFPKLEPRAVLRASIPKGNIAEDPDILKEVNDRRVITSVRKAE